MYKRMQLLGRYLRIVFPNGRFGLFLFPSLGRVCIFWALCIYHKVLDSEGFGRF